MGLFQDQTDSLSELKRLAALVTDSSRRDEIGAAEWPLAMIAYGLVTCNDRHRLPEGIEIYALFQTQCTVDARRKCAQQLAAFIKQRRGDGWRALLPFALADKDAAIRRQAAFLIYTLAAPTADERFTGVAAMLELIATAPLPGTQCPAPALEALLSMGDLRMMPYLTAFAAQIPTDRLSALIANTQSAPTALACEWLTDTVVKHPEQADAVAKALCAMPLTAKDVMDVIIPIPTWQFKSTAVQPLHSWTCPEYWLRIKERLATTLNSKQLQDLEAHWTA